MLEFGSVSELSNLEEREHFNALILQLYFTNENSVPLLSLAIKELPIAKQLPNIDKSVGKWLFIYTTGKRRNLCSHLTTCVKNSILFLGEWSPNKSYLINYIMRIYYIDELVGIFEYLKFGCIFHSMKYGIVSQSQGKFL